MSSSLVARQRTVVAGYERLVSYQDRTLETFRRRGWNVHQTKALLASMEAALVEAKAQLEMFQRLQARQQSARKCP